MLTCFSAFLWCSYKTSSALRENTFLKTKRRGLIFEPWEQKAVFILVNRVLCKGEPDLSRREVPCSPPELPVFQCEPGLAEPCCNRGQGWHLLQRGWTVGLWKLLQGSVKLRMSRRFWYLTSHRFRHQIAHLDASLVFLAASRTGAVVSSANSGGWYIAKRGPLLLVVTFFLSWLSFGHWRHISALYKADIHPIFYRWNCLSHVTVTLRAWSFLACWREVSRSQSWNNPKKQGKT